MLQVGHEPVDVALVHWLCPVWEDRTAPKKFSPVWEDRTEEYRGLHSLYSEYSVHGALIWLCVLCLHIGDSWLDNRC